MQKILLASALAMAGTAFLLPAAHASGTYNDGDLFLGFRSSDPSITSDFFVDIGQPDQFETAAPGTVITLGNFGADLGTVFGNSGAFYSSTTLFSVIGAANFGTTSGKDPQSTLFTTVPVGQSLFAAKNDLAQSGAATTISNLGNHFATQPRNGASTSSGVIEATSTSNSYRSFQPGGSNSGNISFQYFNPSNENAVTVSSAKLEEIIATDDGPNGRGKSGAVLLGTVTVDSTGKATFIAVPEPGSGLLLALGGALGLSFYRRRRLLA